MSDSSTCEFFGKYSDAIIVPFIHKNNRSELVDILASQLGFRKAIGFRNKADEIYRNQELNVISDIERGIVLDWLDCTEVNYRAKRLIRLLQQ